MYSKKVKYWIDIFFFIKKNGRYKFNWRIVQMYYYMSYIRMQKTELIFARNRDICILRDPDNFASILRDEGIINYVEIEQN